MNFNVNHLRTLRVLIGICLLLAGGSVVYYYQYARPPHSMKIWLKSPAAYAGCDMEIEVFAHIPDNAASQAHITDSGDSGALLKTPCVGIEVHAFLENQNKVTLSQTHGKTGTNGFCHLILTIPKQISGKHTLVVTSRENCIYGDSRLERELDVTAPPCIVLSTDKTCYHPGDEGRIRVFLLGSRNGKPRTNSILLEIMDSENRKIFRDYIFTAEPGVAIVFFKLAQEIREDRYKILAQEGENKAEIAIELRKCEVPEFGATLSLSIVPETGYLVPGLENILYCIVAGSNGEPVPNATIDIGSKRLTTDRYGIAQYRVVPKPTMGVHATVQTELEKQDYRIHLQSRQKVEDFSESRVFVSPRDSFQVIILGKKGNIFNTKISIPEFNLSSERFEPVPEFKDKRLYDKEVLTLKIEDRYGNTKTVTKDIVHLEEEFDEIQIALRDAQAFINIGYNPDNPPPAILLRTDRGVYLENEPIQMEILSTVTQGNCVLDVYKNGRKMESTPLSFQTGRVLHSIRPRSIAPRFTGILQLFARSMQADGTAYGCGKSVYIVSQDKLQVKMESDKNVYKPGDTAKISFQLMDQNGLPTPGVIAASVADQTACDLEKDGNKDRVPLFFSLDAEIFPEETSPKILPGGMSLSRAIWRRICDRQENLDDVAKILLTRASPSLQSLFPINMTQTATEKGVLQTVLTMAARIETSLVADGILALFLSILLTLSICTRQRIRVTEANGRNCLNDMLRPCISTSCVNAVLGLPLILILCNVHDMSALVSNPLVILDLVFVIGFTIWKFLVMADTQEPCHAWVIRWIYFLCFLQQTLFLLVFILLPMAKPSLSSMETSSMSLGFVLMPLAILFLRNKVTGNPLFFFDRKLETEILCYLTMLTAIFFIFCGVVGGVIVSLIVIRFPFSIFVCLFMAIPGLILFLYLISKSDGRNFHGWMAMFIVVFFLTITVATPLFSMRVHPQIIEYYRRFASLEHLAIIQLEARGFFCEEQSLYRSTSLNAWPIPNFSLEIWDKNTSLVTDQQGQATMEIKIGDSITTWRVTAAAHDFCGNIAQTSLKILVSKP